MPGARIVGIYQSNLYVPDRGGAAIPLRARTLLPEDFTEADFTALALSGGHTPVSYAGNVLNPGTPNPCPESKNLKFRKLTFYRGNGHSISMKVNVKANLGAVAIAMRNIINGRYPTQPVVCIKLKGERFLNIYDQLGGTGTITPTANLPRSAGKQAVYNMRMTYVTDNPVGAEVIMPVKINSDDDTAPPTALTTEWSDCVGDAVLAAVCRGRQRREHRRYIATVLGTDGTDTLSFLAEIPVASATPADILTCGQNLAQNAAVYCIGYRGEDNDRFHNTL